jgi:hypothetical protein
MMALRGQLDGVATTPVLLLEHWNHWLLGDWIWYQNTGVLLCKLYSAFQIHKVYTAKICIKYMPRRRSDTQYSVSIQPVLAQIQIQYTKIGQYSSSSQEFDLDYHFEHPASDAAAASKRFSSW